MSGSDKAVVTCALTGVLTNPTQFPVPVTPKEMAQAARQARDAGATIVHCHFRMQEEGMGHLPTWDPEVVAAVCDAIRAEVPDILINLTTGVMGPDLSGPIACLERVKPEMAALNAGSLNYLKARSDGRWAWPPLLFDNPVDKVEQFVEVMNRVGIIPECECFDTGIVRSVKMYLDVGLLKPPAHVSLVMGVASGMPCKPEWLPLIVAELPEGAHFQTIGIGQREVWPVHRRAAELGGHLRSGVEDTFYLPDGTKTDSNGKLIEALVGIAREVGRPIATSAQARELLGVLPGPHGPAGT